MSTLRSLLEEFSAVADTWFDERTNVDENYAFQEHRIRSCTIDLAQDWTGIRQALLRMIGEA